MRLVRTRPALAVRRLTAVLAVLALTAAPVPATAAPAVDIPLTDVGFRATFDPAVVGGDWRLTTHSAADPTKVLTLATGRVPLGGVVVAHAPLTSVLASSHRNYLLTAFKATGAGAGLVAARDIGPSADQLVGGALVDLGTAGATPVGAGRPAVTRTSSGPAAGCDDEQEAQSPSLAPAAVAIAPGETRPPALTTGTLTTPPAAKSSCDSVDLVAQNPGAQACELMPGGVGTTCLMGARVLTGQLAFRGHAERSQGSLNTFKVSTEAMQKWQNGLRYSGGGFGISGTTSKTNTTGGEDVWPRRGDCFTDNGVQRDIPPCWSDGRWRDAGRDTWYWERRQDRYFQSGTVHDYERLFVTSYDGGAEYLTFPGRVGYYSRPSEVRAGGQGSWTRHLPGSNRTTFNQSAVEHSVSVSIAVNFPESMGTVTFESTMTHQRLEKVTNFYEFRGDINGFSQAAPGWPAGQGSWYRYDRGTGWGFEHFSCEFAPGWVPANADTKCWVNGS